MPLSDALIQRYDKFLESQRNQTGRALAAVWDGLGSYGQDDIERFLVLSAPILRGAKQSSIAASTALFAIAMGVPPPAVNSLDVEVDPRIDHPFLATWHAVAEGRPNDEAIAAGRSQAQAVAADYVQQVARRTGDVAARQANVRTTWRRVPNAGACQWCQTIAGQRYRTAESADFGHDRCYCHVMPAEALSGRRVSDTTSRGEGRRAQSTSPLHNATDRANQARRELAVETDPARRRRLEERIRRWDARAETHARALTRRTEAAAQQQIENFNRMLGRLDEQVRDFRRR